MGRRGKSGILMPRSNKKKLNKTLSSSDSSPQSVNKSPAHITTEFKTSVARQDAKKAFRNLKTKGIFTPDIPSEPRMQPNKRDGEPLKQEKRSNHALKTKVHAFPSPKQSPLITISKKKAQMAKSPLSKMNTKTRTASTKPKKEQKSQKNAQEISVSPVKVSTPKNSTPRKRLYDSSRENPVSARPMPNKSQSTESIIDELRQKFQQLNMLRTTAAESLLEQYKENAESRIKASESLIESLRLENQALKQHLKEASSSINLRSDNHRMSDISIITNDRVEQPKPLIDLYRRMSGMQILVDSESTNLWHCSLEGRHGEFTFDLRLNEEASEYSYTPTFPAKSVIASRLPAYLLEEIAFDCDQIQSFFWRALNFLMTNPSNSK